MAQTKETILDFRLQTARLVVALAGAGDRIRKARAHANISRLELSEKTGIAPSVLRLIERSKLPKPYLEPIYLISFALNLNPAWVLYGSEFVEAQAMPEIPQDVRDAWANVAFSEISA